MPTRTKTFHGLECDHPECEVLYMDGDGGDIPWWADPVLETFTMSDGGWTTIETSTDLHVCQDHWKWCECGDCDGGEKIIPSWWSSCLWLRRERKRREVAAELAYYLAGGKGRSIQQRTGQDRRQERTTP